MFTLSLLFCKLIASIFDWACYTLSAYFICKVNRTFKTQIVWFYFWLLCFQFLYPGHKWLELVVGNEMTKLLEGLLLLGKPVPIHLNLRRECLSWELRALRQCSHLPHLIQIWNYIRLIVIYHVTFLCFIVCSLRVSRGRHCLLPVFCRILS